MPQSPPPESALVSDAHVERRGAGDGPLRGLRFMVKDMFDLTGHTSGFGNPDWRASHGPAAKDAPVVTRLVQAGADLVGVTQMDELAFSLAGDNAHHGTPLNPRAPGHIPGGSSSGSASATASGLCDFALGTDTGGSIRVPASYCKLYGLRPTHGRIAVDGVVPLAPSFDTVGWFARDAATFCQVGEVLLGSVLEERAHAPRVVFVEEAWQLLDPVSRGLLRRAVEERCAALGSSTSDASLGERVLERWYWAFRRIQAAEIWRAHGDWIERHRPRFGPGIGERLVATRALAESTAHVEEDLAVREAARQRLAGLVGAGTLLCVPAAAGPPPRRGTPTAELEAFRDHTLQLTCIAGLSGLPQVSLPMVDVEGLPLGVGFVAAAGDDEALLALAGRFS